MRNSERTFKKTGTRSAYSKTLEKVNPRFYPTPNKQIVDGETGKVVSLEDIKSGFLTKHDYMALYDTCSRILHADNPFSTKRDPRAFLNSVPVWMEKIRRLLNHHTIQLIDSDKQLWVLMKTDTDGKARVWEFKRLPEGHGRDRRPQGSHDH